MTIMLYLILRQLELIAQNSRAETIMNPIAGNLAFAFFVYSLIFDMKILFSGIGRK